MRTRGGTEDVPLTEAAQEMLGPRWRDVHPFIPWDAGDWEVPPQRGAEVTYWSLSDDSLF